MAVRVEPAEFRYVFYNAAEIATVVSELLVPFGFDGATEVTVKIDESVPMGRARIDSIDPIVLALESGAVENSKRLRQFGRSEAIDVFGRLLLQVRDRRDPAFGAPSLDADVPPAHRTAWLVYCAGRQSRAGFPTQRQRRLYAFRTRHGFTDDTDATFRAIWNGTGLAWVDLVAMSDSCREASTA